jgi:hypothetical protein
MAKKRESKQVAIAAAYQTLLAGPKGKLIVQDLMSRGHVLSPHVPLDQVDPYTIAFREGERNMVLYILQKLQIDLKKLQDMIEERKEEEHYYV